MDFYNANHTKPLLNNVGSSSIGVKILSFVLRQLTYDFKEENTEKESVKHRNPIS